MVAVSRFTTSAAVPTPGVNRPRPDANTPKNAVIAHGIHISNLSHEVNKL